MRPRATRLPLLAMLLLAALAAGACAASSEPEEGVRVTKAWARTTAPTQEVGALYAVITGGPEADRLVNVEAASRIAAGAEIHETMTMDHGADADGAMTMRPADGIEIPAGGTVALEPGGYHVMLTGLKKPLAAGDVFDVTFVFAKAGALNVSVTVRES